MARVDCIEQQFENAMGLRSKQDVGSVEHQLALPDGRFKNGNGIFQLLLA